MIRPFKLALLLLLALGLAANRSPAAEPALPYTIAGEIRDEGQAKMAGEVLGSHGVWIVRDRARWHDVEDKLSKAGWSRGRATAVRDVEFDKVNLVYVFAYGDEGNKFSVHKLDTAADRADLNVVMSYIIYKKRERVVNKFHFLAVAVPRVATTKVSVGTYHPQNGGPYPSPDKALLEWSHEFTRERGDVVSQLTGVVRPAKPTVKPGEDIRCEFELQFAPAAQVKGQGQFAVGADSAIVWDGKYSEGYRNNAFLVQTPDGKAQVFRRAVQGTWEKNVPHPISVSAAKPYVLPNWVETDHAKSLKELGLDTTKPGKYTITGLYMETAQPAGATRGPEHPAMWGGDIATNTVVVEVKE